MRKGVSHEEDGKRALYAAMVGEEEGEGWGLSGEDGWIVAAEAGRRALWQRGQEDGVGEEACPGMSVISGCVSLVDKKVIRGHAGQAL